MWVWNEQTRKFKKILDLIPIAVWNIDDFQVIPDDTFQINAKLVRYLNSHYKDSVISLSDAIEAIIFDT